jgi:CHASE3 domain sensor protein
MLDNDFIARHGIISIFIVACLLFFSIVFCVHLQTSEQTSEAVQLRRQKSVEVKLDNVERFTNIMREAGVLEFSIPPWLI